MVSTFKSIEAAQEVVNRLQSRLDATTQQKIDAQSRLYDLVFQSQPKPTEAELKSTIVFLQGDLKKVISERDKAKARGNEYLAEINLLKLKLSNIEKGK